MISILQNMPNRNILKRAQTNNLHGITHMQTLLNYVMLSQES
jgi:hypothetical protein